MRGSSLLVSPLGIILPSASGAHVARAPICVAGQFQLGGESAPIRSTLST